MAARFCPQCGTAAVQNARFCIQCGAGLAGAHRPARGGGWQLTAAGSSVLGFFLIAGLAIWTTILSPSPPKPGPGGGAPRTAAAPGAGLPEGHPKVATTLPQEAKDFITDLAARTKEKPDDAAAWARLGQVYYRAAQLDAAYFAEAQAAFEHVLDLDPRNADALRGMANVHYDRDHHKEAIAFYERYLAQRPDDLGARTDLGTMYLSAGDAPRALAAYQDVLGRDPSFMQAHYNLAVLFHQKGDDAGALAELNRARGLATEDGVRRQIDEMIAALPGTAPGPATPGAPAAPAGAAPSAFQTSIERALREHPIMGPKIVRFEWSGPGEGRAVVQNFPMEAMPPAVREKFTARLADTMRQAKSANTVDGPIRLEIADASSGAVMATVTP
jgi:tetratricopeptide (TPR) repeat protein